VVAVFRLPSDFVCQVFWLLWPFFFPSVILQIFLGYFLLFFYLYVVLISTLLGDLYICFFISFVHLSTYQLHYLHFIYPSFPPLPFGIAADHGEDEQHMFSPGSFIYSFAACCWCISPSSSHRDHLGAIFLGYDSHGPSTLLLATTISATKHITHLSNSVDNNSLHRMRHHTTWHKRGFRFGPSEQLPTAGANPKF